MNVSRFFKWKKEVKDERNEFLEYRSRLEKEIDTLLGTIIKTLYSLCQGDLYQTLEIDTGGEFSDISEKMKNMINTAITNLREVVISAKSSISSVQQSTKSIDSFSSEKIKVISDLNDKGQLELAGLTTIMNEIEEYAKKISSIGVRINDISREIEILSLNAAIESARVGEAGRGFAIVAKEVRRLAAKTDDLVHQISEVTDISHEKISGSLTQAGKVRDKMTEVSESAFSMIEVIREMSSGLLKNANDSSTIMDIFRVEVNYNENLTHGKMRMLAMEYAVKITRLFEEAIEKGDITGDELFDTNYKEIPNTNPKKYNTAYIDFATDKLPGIQEQLYRENTFIVYCICADQNGYVPQHNLLFCKPITGNYDRDFIGNRTKRIFGDRVGKMVGKHQEEHLLQIYRRDTGVLMYDASAPIYVNGMHWGGFRIGYTLNPR